MNYQILYDYATKNHLSYNELCATVNEAAEADLRSLDVCRQELARLYQMNQAMIGKKPLDKKEIINRMAEHLREQKAAQDLKDHEFRAKGICPVCKGTGELGGQFTGGTWTCEDCNGTGKYYAETY